MSSQETYKYYKNLLIKSLQIEKHRWIEEYNNLLPMESYSWFDFFSPLYGNIQFKITTISGLDAMLLVNNKVALKFEVNIFSILKKEIRNLFKYFNCREKQKLNITMEDNMPLHNQAKEALQKLDEQINEWNNKKRERILS